MNEDKHMCCYVDSITNLVTKAALKGIEAHLSYCIVRTTAKLTFSEC